jgi:hypothetical protein
MLRILNIRIFTDFTDDIIHLSKQETRAPLFHGFYLLSNHRIINIIDTGSWFSNLERIHFFIEPRFDFSQTFEEYWETTWTYDHDEHDFVDPTDEELNLVITNWNQILPEAIKAIDISLPPQEWKSEKILNNLF